MTITTSNSDYQSLVFDYKRCADQDASRPVRHPVVIVGAGPVGLSVAIDLAQQGEQVVLLDDDDRLSNGSRAICFAKRTLEIFDRLDVAGPWSTRVSSGTSARSSFVANPSTVLISFLKRDTNDQPS